MHHHRIATQQRTDARRIGPVMGTHTAQNAADDTDSSAATEQPRHDRPEYDAPERAEDYRDVLFHGCCSPRCCAGILWPVARVNVCDNALTVERFPDSGEDCIFLLRCHMDPMTPFRPALFLDRDGVINIDKGYVSQPAEFEFVEGAPQAIAAFNQRGWYVFVVTNQSGIARNYYTEDDMHALHGWMEARLSEAGARIDRIYHCPYHEEGENPRYRKDSIDRKPKPGMLLRALSEFPVKREASFLIGDKDTDIQAARAAGIAGFLFTGGNLATFAEWTLASFEDGNRG